MKNTPGPWHVNTLENPLRTIHATRGHVATVSDGTMKELGADEIEANARLIAAAPELLEACKQIYKEMGSRISPAAFDEFSEKAKAALIAAIAKAEGRV